MTSAKLSTTGTPAAEHDIDAALARDLLRAQHPDLADRPLRPFGGGWDNTLFRLGNHHLLRLPRRQLVAPLIHHEQRWLPRLAPQLPLPIPAPQRIGTPACGYPWHWSVVPWIPGNAAAGARPDDEQATILGQFLNALHCPAPEEAPRNPMRGVPLAERGVVMEERLQRLETHGAISTTIRKRWEETLYVPIDIAPTWVHGDLHPRNALVDAGKLSGIIDWGDLNRGDCSTDLAAFWMLFDKPAVREQGLAAYGGITPATRQRAIGWALFFGVVFLDTGLIDNPRDAELGRRILENVKCEM